MRFHRWGCVGYAFGKDWEHHVFPTAGRDDCTKALCGLHVGGVTRAQRGSMWGKCGACAALAPLAEARAAAREAAGEETTMECKITRIRGKGNDYTVTFNGMTRGAILAVRQALVAHAAAGSAVGADVLAFLDYGIRSSEDPDVGRAVIDAANICSEITPGPCSIPGPPSTVPAAVLASRR